MDVISRRAILTMTLASLAYDWGCGGGDGLGRRKFPDEQAAVEHLRKNQAAFQKLAADWLAAGHDSFCTFGTDDMLWGNESIEKSNRVWTRRVLEKDGWTDRPFKSLDEAAATVGTTGKELLNWQGQMLALSIECVTTKPIADQGKSGRYVQCTFSPPLLDYGFRFTPASDAVASEVLARWVSMPPSAAYAMRAVDSGWFYYERVLHHANRR